MRDLRIQVEEVRGFCDLPMRPGDYFELRGGRIHIPDGKYICMWAMAAILPMLPAKQRAVESPNDWLPSVQTMICPDPKGGVLWRITTLEGDYTGSPRPPRIQVDASACSGCRSCELACSLGHTGEYSPAESRIQVEKDEPRGLDEPQVCRQCGVALCVEVCPHGALSRQEETRAVLVDEDLCTGCGLCVKACPFAGVRLWEEKALICDLCQGDPACVKACVTGALQFSHEEM